MKFKKLLYVPIVVLCVAVDIFMHIFASQFSPTNIDQKEYSVLVGALGLQLVPILWAFLAFGTAAFLFLKFQHRIYGYGIQKGILYGLMIGVLYFLGVIEGHSLFGNPLQNELIMAFCDAIPMLLMGLLLGATLPSDTIQLTILEPNTAKPPIALSLILFTINFTVIRVFLYSFEIIESGYYYRPFATLSWTVLMGAFTGILYLVFERISTKGSPSKSSIKFSFIIFSVNWFSFGIFILLLYKGTLLDVLIRNIADIFAVYVSFIIISKVRNSLVKVLTE